MSRLSPLRCEGVHLHFTHTGLFRQSHRAPPYRSWQQPAEIINHFASVGGVAYDCVAAYLNLADMVVTVSEFGAQARVYTRISPVRAGAHCDTARRVRVERWWQCRACRWIYSSSAHYHRCPVVLRSLWQAFWSSWRDADIVSVRSRQSQRRSRSEETPSERRTPSAPSLVHRSLIRDRHRHRSSRDIKNWGARQP